MTKRTTANLNQRKGGGTEYERIQTIESNKHVSYYGFSFVDGRGEVWDLVEYNDKMGFCNAKYLKEVKA